MSKTLNPYRLFLTSSLTAEIKSINFPLFQTIDKRRFVFQLIKLKNKELWTLKFEVIKCDLQSTKRKKEILAVNHKRINSSKCQKEDQIILDVRNSLPESLNQLKTVAFRFLTIFGSIYICEQTFSNINLIKNNDACSKLRL